MKNATLQEDELPDWPDLFFFSGGLNVQISGWLIDQANWFAPTKYRLGNAVYDECECELNLLIVLERFNWWLIEVIEVNEGETVAFNYNKLTQSKQVGCCKGRRVFPLGKFQMSWISSRVEHLEMPCVNTCWISSAADDAVSLPRNNWKSILSNQDFAAD